MQKLNNLNYLKRAGCRSDKDLSCFSNHPFNKLSLWVQTILYSFMILKPSVIQKNLGANALLLACRVGMPLLSNYILQFGWR